LTIEAIAMENSIHPIVSEEKRRDIGRVLAGISLGAVTIALVLVSFSVLASRYVFGGMSDESVVLRCDRFAVAAADRASQTHANTKEWRRERQRAFQRCVDDSLQDSHARHS
jgi:hypothetical protein